MCPKRCPECLENMHKTVSLALRRITKANGVLPEVWVSGWKSSKAEALPQAKAECCSLPGCRCTELIDLLAAAFPCCHSSWSLMYLLHILVSLFSCRLTALSRCRSASIPILDSCEPVNPNPCPLGNPICPDSPLMSQSCGSDLSAHYTRQPRIHHIKTLPIPSLPRTHILVLAFAGAVIPSGSVCRIADGFHS